MSKVLIICGSFPPQSDVGGVRPAMMAKYLPRYGWEPYVLTRTYGVDHVSRDHRIHLDGVIMKNRLVGVEVTAREERKYLLRRGFYGMVRDLILVEKAFPPGVFDKIWRVAKTHYAKSDFDAIWATAPDFPELRIGRDLSVRLGIPWVADFRDISEQNDAITEGWRLRLLRLRSTLRRKMLLRNATYLTSVSSFHCQTLEAKTGKPCELIYNGYDADLFRPIEPVRTERFRIVYMGRILSKNIQNPSLLFAALDALLSEGRIDTKHVEILFYATEPKILRSIAGSFRSWEFCQVCDRIDYKDVPEILRNASVLLLLSEYARHGILTTKLFEYLAMERPILCVRTEPESEIAAIVHDANAGYAGDNLDCVKAFILCCYDQWCDQGFCTAPVKRDYVMNFSREAQAMRLAAVLNRVIGSSNAAN
jgi:glycosyltransferase involved in cell wall biosynthesis